MPVQISSRHNFASSTTPPPALLASAVRGDNFLCFQIAPGTTGTAAGRRRVSPEERTVGRSNDTQDGQEGTVRLKESFKLKNAEEKRERKVWSLVRLMGCLI